MIKRTVLTLASTAVFLAASAVAGPGVESNQGSHMFMYGDSLYTWDLESGAAVRVSAVWDGFVAESNVKHAGAPVQDPAFQRDAQSGWTIKASAAWDGHIAMFDGATTRPNAVSMLTVKR